MIFYSKWCLCWAYLWTYALWSLQHYSFDSSRQQSEWYFRWYRLKCSLVRACERACMCYVWVVLVTIHTFMLIFMDDDQVSTILYAAPLNNFIVWIVLLLGITDTLISLYIIITENSCFPLRIAREKSVQRETTEHSKMVWVSVRSHSVSLYHAAAAAAAAGKIGIQR